MVESVGIVGSGGGIDAVRAMQASVPASTNEKAVELTAITQPLSPSTRYDPMAAVLITEYFSTEGQVKMQLPSEAAVAYLRSGLTTDVGGVVAADAGADTQAKDSTGVIA